MAAILKWVDYRSYGCRSTVHLVITFFSCCGDISLTDKQMSKHTLGDCIFTYFPFWSTVQTTDLSPVPCCQQANENSFSMCVFKWCVQGGWAAGGGSDRRGPLHASESGQHPEEPLGLQGPAGRTGSHTGSGKLWPLTAAQGQRSPKVIQAFRRWWGCFWLTCRIGSNGSS